LTNGGVPNLALISVGDITSGLPGGTLTFTGLDVLLLASQGGSINLGSEITFRGIPTLFFYARGTNGDLTLASPIIGTTDLFLYAGRNITFNAGTDLIAAGQFSVRSAGGLTVNGGSLSLSIGNSNGGNIGTGGNITLNTGANLTVNGGGALTLDVLNNDGGHIGTGGNISVTTGGDLTAGSIDALINNRNGGSITSGANLTFDIGGALSTQGDATFVISNRDDGSGGNVDLTLGATSISAGGILITDISTNRGGQIIGSAHNTVDAAARLSAGTLDFEIENAGFDSGSGFAPGGTIDSDAILSVTASDISTASDSFNEIIANNGGGHIGGNATVNVLASTMDVATDAFFTILNGENGQGTPAGSIVGNAAIQVTAGNVLVGGFIAVIDNSGGGSIGGSAIVNFNLSGAIDTQGDADFQIFNQNNGSGGGSIGSDATINVTAANITANSLTAQIDNTGGSIGGNATINMNVSGSATVTNDATFQMLGSDGAAAAAINFNGGSYTVGSAGSGGMFLSSIDGNGTITFNSASAHADVLKAGVFGANGVVRIGGGTLSADSTLKLYAPGSNGQLNFVSNVTLGGNGAKILAANSITIFNGVVVTIGGPNPADVFVNFAGGVPNANYTGFGGNGTTTGTFAGAGANGPEPLSIAPPFGPSSPAPITTRTRIHPRPPVTTGVINVSSSDELLALLDDFTPGRGGRIRIPDSNRGSHGRNASRSNAAAYLNAARRAMDRRTASTPAMRRLPQ
jgi:fibronectin-binding autotransporter adhesin